MKRSTPLRSKSRLARKSPLKRTGRLVSRPPRRLSSPGAAEGRAYMTWVRTQLCCARFMGPCAGPLQSHHAGRRPGVGLKCSDFETVPLCTGHHGELHTNAGAFKRWTKARLREWSAENIAFTRKLFADAHVEAGLPVPAKVAA